MKYVSMIGPKQSVIKEGPMPTFNDDQLLIKMKYVGVCMSEHYGWSTAKPGDCFGHEPMGIVEAVGKNVKDFAPGDRVSGSWGGSLPGAGGMVQYATANPHRDIVVKLPDNVRDEDLVLEPLACMMSAVSKVRCSLPGATVCVVGCGYMGCGLISLLKLRGAYVVAVDIRQASLDNAKLYGADEVYLYEEADKKFNTLTSGFRGFESVMEWSESSDEALDLAVKMTKECGQLCVGAYHIGKICKIDMGLLNLRAIECLSTHPREADLNINGSINAAKLLSSGAWNYKNIPVKIYPMSKFDQAHAELETKYGTYMKALIDMTKEDGEPYIL